MPSMVASPEANCPSEELIVVPFPIPSVELGFIVPPPFAVRLLMLIFVMPAVVPVVPMLLVTVVAAGINVDLPTPTKPLDKLRVVLAPKLVELPTLSDVRLPFVTDRFSVPPPVGAKALTLPLFGCSITDWAREELVSAKNATIGKSDFMGSEKLCVPFRSRVWK